MNENHDICLFIEIEFEKFPWHAKPYKAALGIEFAIDRIILKIQELST
jgi:hypothetical protein